MHLLGHLGIWGLGRGPQMLYYVTVYNSNPSTSRGGGWRYTDLCSEVWNDRDGV